MNRSTKAVNIFGIGYAAFSGMGIFHGLKSVHRTLFTPVCGLVPAFRFPSDKQKNSSPKGEEFFGDPYGNRTHVTAVKGRCLNRLTNGPGSGDLTRTGDRPGMNRVLYQLSYAAIWSISAQPKSASLLYRRNGDLSREKFDFLQKKWGCFL